MELDRLLAEAEALLAIPSTAGRPDARAHALEWMLDLVGPGFAVRRFESGGTPSALVHPAGTGPRFRLILNAHLDVVDAPDEQFRPYRDGARLYGRGSHDMKISALVMAHAFAEYAAEATVPVALQLVTDEEVGGRHGTRYQIEQGVGADFVVIGEQTALSVVTDSRGLLDVYLRATGRTAHGAYPWLGDNALLALLRSLDALLARYPVPASEVWRTTVNVARIATGNTAFNQVPADAEAWLDIRFPPGDPDLDGRSGEQITAYLAGFCAPGVRAEIDHTSPPHHVDPATPDVQSLVRAARSVGYPGTLIRKHGSGDARFYSARGIDAVAFGIGGAGQHGPDEYAEIATIEPYHRALTAFLTSIGPDQH
jgi:succinyl-diaminopimelate desuccinylase